MIEIGGNIYGIESCARALTDAPRQAVPAALARGLAAAGGILEEAIIAVMPVRDVRLGGDEEYPALIEDLRVEIILADAGEGGVVKVGFFKQGYVAAWVEYGHRMVGHKPDNKLLIGGRVAGLVPAHPFIRPAADASAERAIEVFVEAVMEELTRAGVVDADFADYTGNVVVDSLLGAMAA